MIINFCLDNSVDKGIKQKLYLIISKHRKWRRNPDTGRLVRVENDNIHSILYFLPVKKNIITISFNSIPATKD